MCFAIPVTNGKVLCKCCEAWLHHCWNCWEKWHHSGNFPNDYEPPQWFGQSMWKKEVREKFKELTGEDFPEGSIKEDKDREYKEGDYGGH